MNTKKREDGELAGWILIVGFCAMIGIAIVMVFILNLLIPHSGMERIGNFAISIVFMVIIFIFFLILSPSPKPKYRHQSYFVSDVPIPDATIPNNHHATGNYWNNYIPDYCVEVVEAKIYCGKQLENTAELDENAQEPSCDNCSSPFTFGMKDKEHEFSLDLVTVLKCLEFAEIKGAVLPMSSNWWLDVSERYGHWNGFGERFTSNFDGGNDEQP